MTAIEFIKENYTLINGGEDYMCNHSGQLVGAEDIAEAYHQAKLKLLGIADVSGRLSYDELVLIAQKDNSYKYLNDASKINFETGVVIGYELAFKNAR